MLVVNPDESVTVHDVVQYCKEQIEIMDRNASAHKREASKLSRNGNDSVMIESTLSTLEDPDLPQQRRRPTVDPCLIMDDIIEKLQLLEYSFGFCKTRSRPPISRTYFAVKQEDVEKSDIKVEYMVELCYWLMSLGFADSQR